MVPICRRSRWKTDYGMIVRLPGEILCKVTEIFCVVISGSYLRLSRRGTCNLSCRPTTAVPQLLYAEVTTAKWVFPQEKPTLCHRRKRLQVLWNRSKVGYPSITCYSVAGAPPPPLLIPSFAQAICQIISDKVDISRYDCACRCSSAAAPGSQAQLVDLPWMIQCRTLDTVPLCATANRGIGD